jgi:hypothetical protein
MEDICPVTRMLLTAQRWASGISTGSSVTSLTRRTTWGRQNQAVPYQSPSSVLDGCSAAEVGGPRRSSSFLVARSITIAPFCLPVPGTSRA